MHHLDYYIIPSEDAHQTEYVAECDKRREFITGFIGTAGQAIVSMTKAFLITDSRYWLQAKQNLDRNWELVQAGAIGQPKDWIEWLVVRYFPPTNYFVILKLCLRMRQKRLGSASMLE
jgi:Xaa-Pro aminopeptidase